MFEEELKPASVWHFYVTSYELIFKIAVYFFVSPNHFITHCFHFYLFDLSILLWQGMWTLLAQD